MDDKKLTAWLHSFKHYVDNKCNNLSKRIKKLEELQEEYMKEIKEYVDNLCKVKN